MENLEIPEMVFSNLGFELVQTTVSASSDMPIRYAVVETEKNIRTGKERHYTIAEVKKYLSGRMRKRAA